MKKQQIIFAIFTAISIYLISVPQNKHQIDIYDQWKLQYSKQFTPQQDAFRKLIFFKNYQEIVTHNTNPQSNFQKGVNHFTHLTKKEFAALFTQLNHNHKSIKITTQENLQKLQNKISTLGDIDWTVLGKISPVKTQGDCDAGYAFCSVSLAQSWFLFQNKNLTLSQQQVIDCSQSYTTFGCSGGSRAGTLRFIKDKGLQTLAKYPYKGVKGICAAQMGDNKVPFTSNDATGCDNMATALTKSPMTVAVNAREWQTYRSGIFDACLDSDVNHDILLVGVTTSYWKLKNSWGLKWGQYGYIRLKLGNTCGICLNPAFGFIL